MARIGRGRRAWTAAVATLVALACDGDDGDNGPVGTAGSIQVAVNPATLPLPQGSSGSVIASLTRGGGFNGVVTLAVTGLPTGVTTTVTPTQLPGTTTSATIDMTVAAAVAPQTYSATITATAQGVSQATTTYQLTVTEPPTGSTRVEYQFCDAAKVPVFFAYQDGGDTWHAVTGAASGAATSFAFDLARGRGGVLTVYRTASPAVAGALAVGRTVSARRMMGRRSQLRNSARPRFGVAGGRSSGAHRSVLADTYVTQVRYASTAEFVQDAAGSCARTQPTKTVTGTVTGVSAGQYGIVSLGWGNDLFIGGESSNPVTFTDVAQGSVDFVGSRMTPGNAPDRIVVFRNLNIPDGGSLPATIDFDGPASSVPASASATITGSAGDGLEIYVDVVTANGDALLWYDLAPSAVTTRPWAGLTPAAMATGDFHGIYAFASQRPSDSGDYRFALKYVGAVTNQALDLGPTIPDPAVSPVAVGAYPRFRFQGSFPPEYTRGASIDAVSSEEDGNAYGIIATSAYLTAAGNALAYDFTMPDVSGLTGFPAAARLTAGPNDVSISAFGFTGPGIFDVRPNLGSEFRAAIRGATIVAP